MGTSKTGKHTACSYFFINVKYNQKPKSCEIFKIALSICATKIRVSTDRGKLDSPKDSFLVDIS
jgi:hypothetical protein